MQLEHIINYIDWYGFVPMLVAAILGGIIGIERELSGKPAGLRTNILICMGAALFTHISFDLQTDAAKMLAGVVTGVGFIGAGAVLRDRGGVHGITTAATIWLVTGIGIACGMFMYDIAIGITILALLVLFGMNPVDRKIHRPEKNGKSPTQDLEE